MVMMIAVIMIAVILLLLRWLIHISFKYAIDVYD
jgi:hypothetical protein